MARERARGWTGGGEVEGVGGGGIGSTATALAILAGMVHAWVAQKLLKRDNFKSFHDVRFINI